MENGASVDLRIGTSGYDYPEWKGPLYPPDLPRADFLGVYARRFSSVELNFSYYGMPKAANIAALLDRVGDPGLDFSVKANRSLTHEIEPSTWREAAKEFRAGIAPLICLFRPKLPPFRAMVATRPVLNRPQVGL